MTREGEHMRSESVVDESASLLCLIQTRMEAGRCLLHACAPACLPLHVFKSFVLASVSGRSVALLKSASVPTCHHTLASSQDQQNGTYVHLYSQNHSLSFSSVIGNCTCVPEYTGVGAGEAKCSILIPTFSTRVEGYFNNVIQVDVDLRYRDNLDAYNQSQNSFRMAIAEYLQMDETQVGAYVCIARSCAFMCTSDE